MLRQRMYGFVIYQLNGRQAGIQLAHAITEYGRLVANYVLKTGYEEINYNSWADTDKTIIMLDGGTTNEGIKSVYRMPPAIGTMQVHMGVLQDFKITFTKFTEPDLNNAVTAIAFLVDERIWDKEKYPDPVVSFPAANGKELFEQELVKLYGEHVAKLRIWLSQFKLAAN